jgi:hypothetical protein
VGPLATVAGHWIKPPMREADRFQECQLCGGYVDHEGPLPHPAQDQAQ